MRQGMCSECGLKGPLQIYFRQSDKVFCDACTTKLAEPGTGKFRGLEPPSAAIDPTICARCKADNGNSEFPLTGKLPFCAECRKQFYERPYPQWLKLSLAFLLMLLVVALIHGRKYFHAGREMYVGEKLVEQAHYSEATAHLQQTVEIAPNSDKAVLLFAKASLLSGDPGAADKAMRAHNSGQFEVTPEYQEVDRIFERAVSALKETQQAIDLAGQPGKEEEAARLMHHAAGSYSEMPTLSPPRKTSPTSGNWRPRGPNTGTCCPSSAFLSSVSCTFLTTLASSGQISGMESRWESWVRSRFSGPWRDRPVNPAIAVE
ncbi:MAG TPA: hypothetical protein VGZ28_07395 [Terriglobales bacterium]|jgi:hypothetical protein|nr:hypothetical protein [Terriglobales bacterium]